MILDTGARESAQPRLREDFVKQNYRGGRLAFIDTWRVLAVFLVIISHAVGNRSRYGAQGEGTHFYAAYGSTGVFIFFFISGLVVSRTCISECAQYRNFSIPSFYVRRIFRIAPPLLLYLGSCVALDYLGLLNLDPRDLIGASMYVCNISISIFSCGWYGGHTWSLAFEEQFYLLFPILFTAIEINPRAAVKLVYVLPISILPFIFPLPWVGKTGFAVIYALFLLGYLAARRLEPMLRLLRSNWFFVLWPISVIIVFCPIYAFGSVMLIRYVRVLYIAAIPVLVLGTGARNDSLTSLFSNPQLARLGRATYSIYLWQQLFTAGYFSRISPFKQTMAILCMIIGCFFLYELIERPLIRVGRQFSGRIRVPYHG